MKNTLLLILTALIFLACGSKSQITYDEKDGIIFFNNSAINLMIDNEMEIKTSYMKDGEMLSITSEQSKSNDYLIIDGKEVSQFTINKTELNDIKNEFGEGKQLKLYGKTKTTIDSDEVEIEKILTIELYENIPNVAITYASYTNLSAKQLQIDKVIGDSYTVDRKLIDPNKKSYDFSLFQGCGIDWGVNYSNIKVDSTYSAENFMGVTKVHRDPKGGGIPVLDLWGKKMGMAIAHISAKPEFVSLPIKVLTDGKIQYSIEESYNSQYEPISLRKGEKFSAVKYAVIVHSLDYFDALRTYATLLNYQGIKTFKDTPDTVPQSYWKTWGYQLDFKLGDIYAKIPEFRELGIEMIVLDDGWFSNYGDWEPSREEGKFPGGREDLKKFVEKMHQENFKVGVWWCPLIAEPNSEVAKTHPDWVMKKEDGSPYLMEKPDTYFLCPDYEPVLDFWKQQIDKLYKEFDVDYVYHDWANIVEVPPCYNPAHKHESPLSPYWNLSGQYKIMYDEAQSIKPGCAIELCECGRPHDPYKMPYYNITNASDANNKEQVRQRLKVEKALNGSRTYFNPGYIRPIKPTEDWGYDPCEIDECVAMGGYFETYYTDLPEDKKKEWVEWLKIYREEQIYKGEYLNLYDIEFDNPDVIVTRKDDVFYYFAPGPYNGNLELRGLENGKYEIHDLYSKELVANVDGQDAKVNISREGNICLKVKPVK